MQVLVKDGSRYEGIYHNATADKGTAVAVHLKKARLLSSGSGSGSGSTAATTTTTTTKMLDQVTIAAEDFVSVLATDVDLTFADGGRLLERGGMSIERRRL